MGGFSPIRIVRKSVKKVTKAAEKLGKKKLTETFDIVTGMDKEERRTLLYGDPQTPQVTEEVTPEVVPDDETILSSKRRTRSKRAGQAGTLVGGHGALYRQAGSKSATGD